MGALFAGARLRRLREDHGLTQAQLANLLKLSTSYVSQLENDQRPITVSVLMGLAEQFNLTAQYFSSDSQARLIANLRDLFITTGGEHPISDTQIEELVSRMPEVANSIVLIHRRLRQALAQVEQYQAHDFVDRTRWHPQPSLFEMVRNFFYDHHNYIHELDMAAESLFEMHQMSIGQLDYQLRELLLQQFHIRVEIVSTLPTHTKRVFHPATQLLELSHQLTSGQRAFQMAYQVGLVTQSSLIDQIIDASPQLDEHTCGLARIGLAHYFAGAFLLPYRIFHHAAETFQYDIHRLSDYFEVGIETICHRLSTLQRPQHRGIPFIFVRIDQAGNISKRQSATGFHFSRIGGSCPLWIVHEAFTQPGKIVTQIAEMPDGRKYFWIATTISDRITQYREIQKNFAIGLGCELNYAPQLIYSSYLSLDNTNSVVPIGAGCKICPREQCPQRAFPYLGRPVIIDENSSSALPYSPAVSLSSE